MPVDNVMQRWRQGDWPNKAQRGVDGHIYGPGYDADPTGGTDSSPVERQFGSDWLDNVIKLADNGMLHPKVLQMLQPQIDAMIRSQSARGKDYRGMDGPLVRAEAGGGAGRGQLHHDEDLRDAKRRY